MCLFKKNIPDKQPINPNLWLGVIKKKSILNSIFFQIQELFNLQFKFLPIYTIEKNKKQNSDASISSIVFMTY